jgi:hypothetical protein
MWEPRRLTTLWASTTRYSDSFTFSFTFIHGLKISFHHQLFTCQVSERCGKKYKICMQHMQHIRTFLFTSHKFSLIDEYTSMYVCWPCCPVLQLILFCLEPSRLIRPWRLRRHVPPKRQLTFNELHGVILQKTELSITTAVRSLDPTYIKPIWTVTSCGI